MAEQCEVYVATDNVFLMALRRLLDNNEITLDQYCSSLRRVSDKNVSK